MKMFMSGTQKEGVHSQYYGEIVKVLVKDYK